MSGLVSHRMEVLALSSSRSSASNASSIESESSHCSWSSWQLRAASWLSSRVTDRSLSSSSSSLLLLLLDWTSNGDDNGCCSLIWPSAVFSVERVAELDRRWDFDRPVRRFRLRRWDFLFVELIDDEDDCEAPLLTLLLCRWRRRTWSDG